jgi:hypothetical protein
MTSLIRIILVSSVLTLPLAGCASVSDALDPSEWFSGEFFNTKKKLPGDRKAVFPQGVPGVSQGIPSDLVKGNQQPPVESGFAVTETQSVNPPPRAAATGRTAARTDATNADTAKTDTAKTDTAKPEEFQPAPREKAKPKPKPKPATAERQPPAQAPSSASARRAPPEPQQAEQPQQPQRSQRAGSGGGVQWPDPPAQRSGGSQSGGVQWPEPPPLR